MPYEIHTAWPPGATDGCLFRWCDKPGNKLKMHFRHIVLLSFKRGCALIRLAIPLVRCNISQSWGWVRLMSGWCFWAAHALSSWWLRWCSKFIEHVVMRAQWLILLLFLCLLRFLLCLGLLLLCLTMEAAPRQQWRLHDYNGGSMTTAAAQQWRQRHVNDDNGDSSTTTAAAPQQRWRLHGSGGG